MSTIIRNGIINCDLSLEIVEETEVGQKYHVQEQTRRALCGRRKSRHRAEGTGGIQLKKCWQGKTVNTLSKVGICLVEVFLMTDHRGPRSPRDCRKTKTIGRLSRLDVETSKCSTKA